MPTDGIDAAAVPDAGDDTPREMARTITAHVRLGGTTRCSCGEIWQPLHVADALLPRIREHVERAIDRALADYDERRVEQARADERERVSALLASIPDEWYPQDVFGGPLSTDESRQANELLKAEGLPTFDRVGANAMRHAYRIAARIALEEPDDDD